MSFEWLNKLSANGEVYFNQDNKETAPKLEKQSSPRTKNVQNEDGMVEVDLAENEVIKGLQSDYASYDTKIAEYGAKIGSSTTYDSPELKALEGERDEIQTNLQTAQDDLQSVYSGSHPEITALEEEYNNANQEYHDALDLSKNEEIIALKEQITETENAIADNETRIAFYDTQITDTEVQISSQESLIASIDSEISSYTSQISSLKASLSTADDDAKSVINSKISSLQQLEGEAQARKQNAVSMKDALEEKLEALEKSLDATEEELQNQKETLEGLEDDVLKTEDEVVKNALEKLQEAREAFEDKKNELIEGLKSNIEELTASLNAKEEEIAQLKEKLFYEEQEKEKALPVEEQSPVVNSGVYSGSGGGGVSGFSGSNGIGGSVSSNSPEGVTPSIDTTKTNYDESKEELNNTRNSLYEIYEGENAKLKEAKNINDAHFETIVDKVKEFDLNLANKLNNKKLELDKKEEEINSIELQIAKFDDELSDLKTELLGVKLELSALNEVLNSSESLDGETKAELQNKIKELENSKTTLENKIKEKENSKEYQELKTKKAGLQQEYDKIYGELEGLLDEIPNEYLQDEIGRFKTSYADYINKKEDTISELNGKKQTAQAKADELYKTYMENVAKDTASKYSTATKEIPQNVAKSLDSTLGTGFCAKLEEVAKYINCDPCDLLGMMMIESGISPDAVNSSSGATGLIQFMPGTAKGLGTTTSALSQMSAIQQLDYVKAYFGSHSQKLEAGDLYTQCFLPARMGQQVVCNNTNIYPAAYNANSGFDIDKDGQITRDEMTSFVQTGWQRVLSTYGG